MGPDKLGFSLYLVTDRTQTRGRPLIEVVDDCLRAGLQAVQVREKELTALELLNLARPLRDLTSQSGARLFINDRVDVAQAVEGAPA